jgi:hypothetical protein
MSEPALPLPALKPIGDTLLELAQLPLNLVKEGAPEIQRQIQQLPEIVRLNGQFLMQNMRQIPDQIRKDGAKDALNVPLMAAKTISPIPLLSPDEIAEQLKKQTEKK